MPDTIPSRFRVRSLDRMQHLIRFLSDAVIRSVITLDERVEVERLRRALRLSLDAHPIAGCRAPEGWWRPVLVRLDEIDEQALLTVVEVEGDTDAAVEAAVIPIWDPIAGPLVRAILVRGDQDVLVVKNWHLLGDGMGTRRYLYTLASIYRRLGDDPDFVPTPVVGPRGLPTLLRALGPRKAIKAFFAPATGPTFARGWSLPLRSGENEGPALVVRTLPPARMAAMRKLARAERATINDLLMAAYLRAFARVAPPKPGAAYSAATHINLRRWLPDGDLPAVGNCATITGVALGDDLGETMADTVRLVRDAMAPIKAGLPPIRSLMMQALALNALPWRWLTGLIKLVEGPMSEHEDSLGVPMFNNLGVIDAEKLAFGERPARNAYTTACLPGGWAFRCWCTPARISSTWWCCCSASATPPRCWRRCWTRSRRNCPGSSNSELRSFLRGTMPFDPDRHHRKSTRLKGWHYAQGSYHVVICTRWREHTLGEIRDDAMLLSETGRIVQDTLQQLPALKPWARLGAQMIMPNHVHILFDLVSEPCGVPAYGRIPVKTLPALIRSFKAASAARVNQLWDTRGPSLWQSGYYDRVIRNEREWWATKAYIERNILDWPHDPDREGYSP